MRIEATYPKTRETFIGSIAECRDKADMLEHCDDVSWIPVIDETQNQGGNHAGTGTEKG
jgi:hypothetical protein